MVLVTALYLGSNGGIYAKANDGIVVSADPSKYVDFEQNGCRLSFALAATRTSSSPLEISRGIKGDTTLDDSKQHQLMNMRYKSSQVASITVGTSGAELTGFTRMASPAFDSRVFTSPTEFGSATDTLKQLNPYKEGFAATELKAVVPDAVTGEEGATRQIGTLTDWDKTVLQTDVTQPPEEELTYTEDVTNAEGVVIKEFRTRTWTPTGTEPEYQQVDQTKLIPLLTKALQEALERIEGLEGKLSTVIQHI